MAFTNAQILALEVAIASGTRSVQYQDRSVTYQSVEEMFKVLALMKAEIAASTGGRSTFASFRRDYAGQASTPYIDTDV